MKTRLTELLGCQYPIIQGGMAFGSSGKLAAAVSAAGGVGIIGIGPSTQWSREQVRLIMGTPTTTGTVGSVSWNPNPTSANPITYSIS